MLFRFLILIHVCAAFPLKCPEPAQWSLRARSHCPDPSRYFCLKNDFVNGYSENCTVFDFLQPGRKNVLRGGLDADVCSSERYQPWPITYYTNVSTNCIFLKSMCNEEGQVVNDNGNRNTDTTCKCDYTKGYDFLVKPQNPCFCVPSEEDCSCFLKTCHNSTFKLSPDYECIQLRMNISMSQCRSILNGREIKDEKQNQTIYTSAKDNITDPVLWKIYVWIPIFVVCIIYVGLIFTVCAHGILDKYYHKAYLIRTPPASLTFVEGQTMHLTYKLLINRSVVFFKRNDVVIGEDSHYDKKEARRSKTLTIQHITLSDEGKYCLEAPGLNCRSTMVKVTPYLSEIITDVKSPKEGDDITMSCTVLDGNGEHIEAKWLKDEQPVNNTDRVYTSQIITQTYTLMIKKCYKHDIGKYKIEVDGRTRSLDLHITQKYDIPLEIQNMEKAEIEKYIEILKEGKEKKYHIKIMILGRKGIGKTSLMMSLLNEKFVKILPFTDGIDIRKCQVDMDSKEWICHDVFQGDTADDKIGRALRKLHVSDNVNRQEMNGTVQEGHTTAYKTHMKGGNHINEKIIDRPSQHDSMNSEEQTNSSKKISVNTIDHDKQMSAGNQINEEINDRPLRHDSLNSEEQSNPSKNISLKTIDHDKQLTSGNQINEKINNRPLRHDSMNSEEQSNPSKKISVKTIDHDKQMTADKEVITDTKKGYNKTTSENKEQNANNSKRGIPNTTKDDKNDMNVSHNIEKSCEQRKKEQEATTQIEAEETEDINTVLTRGLKATFYDKKTTFADCTIMDFAGHKEYYSTHQSFLTPNAVYLVVFSFSEDNPFAATLDETEKIGFWIDTIRCYAQGIQQERQDTKDGGLTLLNTQAELTEEGAEKSELKEQIIVICTKCDNPNDPKSVKKKDEWQDEFKILRKINKRHPLIWGDVNFISNENRSESEFNKLRSNIVRVAKSTPNWVIDYPVKWISLEEAFNNKRKDRNVLTLKEIEEMAKHCSIPILSNEVSLFLNYQHAIGNILFYNETKLEEFVILDPSWLIDAFKCIVFADECKQFPDIPLSLPEFTNNGRIKQKDLREMIENQCPKYKGNLNAVLSVVEKFDIIVYNENLDSYICPSAIKKGPSSFEVICKDKHIKDKTCNRSSWLCLEFDFLPPALYNHLLVFCMCDNNFVDPELFYEIGIFCIKGRNELDKFFLCKSGRTIALQMFSTQPFSDNSFKLHCDKIPNTQTLFENILEKIRCITSKYRFRVQCLPKIKCGKADYVSEKQRYTLDDITQNKFGGCTHCGDAAHNYEELSSLWFKKEDIGEERKEETKAPSPKLSETESTPSESTAQPRSETEAKSEEQQQEGIKTEEKPKKLEEAQKEKQTEEETQAPSSKPSETEATTADSEAQSQSETEAIPVEQQQEKKEEAKKENQTEEDTQAPSSKPSETEATTSDSEAQSQSETEAIPEEQQQEGSKTEENPKKVEEAKKENQTEEETQAPSSKPSETEATPSESETQSQSETEANPEEQQQEGSKTEENSKMPETIKNMSVYDREAFLKTASTGTTTRYHIRVMIVGKQSAGKTCLLRRLMNEEIDDVISTDGINIERRKCHIDIKTGEWHFYKSSQKPQVLSIDQSKEYADCAFWDFAGQKEFYATHQTFLSANAVYLLVVDISADFKSKTYENMIEKEFDVIGDYIDFWLDNIHCYCTDDKKTAAQENLDSVLNPPVIIVGTGIDKILPNDREERKQKFLKYLSDTISTQPKRRHFRKPHFLSNKYPSDNKQEFEDLRKDIFCKAKDLSNWEEHLPVRWLVLEKEICSIKVKNAFLHAEAKGQTPACGNKKVMLHTEAQCLADECSFPNVKKDTSELDSFLKYEHEIGNVIFFKEVKEFIVLDPEWLVDVFRCFVSHAYSDDTLGMTEWDVLVKTGKLEDTLIETLLQKVPCLILTKHKQYLLELMEEFGIIVKPKNHSSMNDIYMPCMIKPMPFQEIFGKIDVETEYCKQSSWFCLVFNFLPPSYFNHVLVSFVKNNQLFYVKKDRRLGIYRNVGIFQLNNSGSKILVICLSKNLIAMKVVQFNSSEDVCYSYIKTQLINIVDSIKQRYRINVNYEIRFKCQSGSFYDNEGIGYDEAMEKSEYRCTDHNEMHSSKDIYRSWLKEEEVTDELKKKGRRRCNYCKHMSVYKCYDCNQVLCRDCSIKHDNTEKYSAHLMQRISDSFILNCTFPLEDNINGSRFISDIKCLPDGEVVVAVYNEDIPELLVFSISGKRRHVIQLDTIPRTIDIVDKNTVAVILENKIMAFVDVQQNHVQYIRDIAIPYSLNLFIYIENEFYIGVEFGIVVLDMSVSVKRRIILSFTPYAMCYDVDSKRIYCIDRDNSKLICIDRDGNDIFTFTDPSITFLKGLTIDNEGNVLVLCETEDDNSRSSVIKVDSNGEKSEVVITNINTSTCDPRICYDHLTNSVVIASDNEVYIYKKK